MWRLIPVSEYIADRATAPEPEKSIWHYLRQHFFPNQGAPESVEIEFDTPDLQSAPTRLLDWIAPSPDWSAAWHVQSPELDSDDADGDEPSRQMLRITEGQIFDVLDAELADWTHAYAGDPGIRVILAAPHSGVQEMVYDWAYHRDYLLCGVPTCDQVWSEFDSWRTQVESLVDAQGGGSSRLVLVGLERCFVRHHNGLEFIRRLMVYLATSAPPALLVCDSWAWAYLRDAIHLDAIVRPPLTLARQSGETLCKWLINLSNISHHRAFTFRLGGDVLFTVGDGQHDEMPAVHEKFFDELAELSRGNLGVAQAIWRNNMSVDAEVDVGEQVQREAADDPGYTIWVRPIKQIEIPSVPTTFNNDDALILHALLIHNGISLDLLRQALPISASRISRRLQVMGNANLARERAERFEVTPFGYVPVRNFLRESGFFVDDL